MKIPVFGIIPLIVTVIADDYDTLVDYANIVSFSYCIKSGLSLGPVSCPMERCEAARYKAIEILEIFNFNDMGDIGSGFYAIDLYKHEIILSFRGTSSRRDWFANIDIAPIPYEPLINLRDNQPRVVCKGCKVHRGYYNFLRKNLEDILVKIKHLKTENPDYKVVVLGHSLGGALALLSGIEMHLMGYNPLVLTYAGPKIGNRKMMSFVDGLFDTKSLQGIDHGYIRVVHTRDIVPMLPPTNFFVHGGIEYFISKRYLPHLKHDVERKMFKVAEAFPMIGRIFPETAKYEHTHYFLKISGCKD